jgi:hypothetical protein
MLYMVIAAPIVPKFYLDLPMNSIPTFLFWKKNDKKIGEKKTERSKSHFRRFSYGSPTQQNIPH